MFSFLGVRNEFLAILSEGLDSEGLDSGFRLGSSRDPPPKIPKNL